MQVTFKVEYRTVWGESLSLVMGNVKHPMTWNDGNIWSLTLDSVKAADLQDYTYVLIRDGLILRPEWEHHSKKVPARCKNITIEDKWNDCPIPGCPFPRKHQAEMFDRPGFRGAGTAVPVFSLRSQNDFGIGEFADLHPLIDWAAATGQCVIQLLPVNDTTRKGEWADSYPYSPISTFALHPLYLNLQALGVRATAAFKKEQAELNALPEIDYPRVFKAKMAYIRKAFEAKWAKDSERLLAGGILLLLRTARRSRKRILLLDSVERREAVRQRSKLRPLQGHQPQGRPSYRCKFGQCRSLLPS